jgi:hypothetical protein
MPLLKIDSSIRICSGLGVQRVRTGSGESGSTWIGLVWKCSGVCFSMEEEQLSLTNSASVIISRYVNRVERERDT